MCNNCDNTKNTCPNCSHCITGSDNKLYCINVAKWRVALFGPRSVTFTDHCKRIKLREAKVVNSR